MNPRPKVLLGTRCGKDYAYRGIQLVVWRQDCKVDRMWKEAQDALQDAPRSFLDAVLGEERRRWNTRLGTRNCLWQEKLKRKQEQHASRQLKLRNAWCARDGFLAEFEFHVYERRYREGRARLAGAIKSGVWVIGKAHDSSDDNREMYWRMKAPPRNEWGRQVRLTQGVLVNRVANTERRGNVISLTASQPRTDG